MRLVHKRFSSTGIRTKIALTTETAKVKELCEENARQQDAAAESDQKRIEENV